MNKGLYIFSFIFLATALFSSCQSSRHFTKLAIKQEEAGLVPQAAESYYMAVKKNRNNVEALVGMKKNGQLVLNSLLNDFAKQKNFGTNREAVNAFHLARDYKNKIQTAGVTLLLADFYEADYENAKNGFLMELYEEGTTLLEEQKYLEAESKFAEIRKLEPDYKDAKELGDIAYLEPLYSEGKKEMMAENYRMAHNNFSRVVSKKSDYKDAADLKAKCLEKGMYTIALLNFENSSGTPGLNTKVSAYILDALTDIQDPFLRVVDRANLEAIIKEQQLQLSGIIDENTAVQVGELVGAQAMVSGAVLSYSEKKGTLKSKQREGYISYQERVLNKTDGKYYMQSRYKLTNYTEYYNSNSCSISFQYKLINLKTGEIIKTEIIQKEMADEVLYGKFDGDIGNLFPAGMGGPNLNAQDKRALMGMMQGRQELKSSTELSNALYSGISSQVKTAIGQSVKEIVK